MPLELVLQNRESSGCIAKWAVEVTEFKISFISTWAIKSRALTNFITKWTPVPESKSEELTV